MTERVYFDIGRLIAEMPELGSGQITHEVQGWLASANALVKSRCTLAEALQLKVACQNLDGPLRIRNAEIITSILRRTLAKAEANAPRELRGSIILLGGSFEAYKGMQKFLAAATSDALLIDSGADGKVLADYAILAPERVTVRILADEAHYGASLAAGALRWQQRLGNTRHLIVRLAPANLLQERLVFLDGARAWVLGAPFSELAKRTYTALMRMRPEDEARKLAVYSEIWEEAEPLSPRSLE